MLETALACVVCMGAPAQVEVRTADVVFQGRFRSLRPRDGGTEALPSESIFDVHYVWKGEPGPTVTLWDATPTGLLVDSSAPNLEPGTDYLIWYDLDHPVVDGCSLIDIPHGAMAPEWLGPVAFAYGMPDDVHRSLALSNWAMRPATAPKPVPRFVPSATGTKHLDMTPKQLAHLGRFEQLIDMHAQRPFANWRELLEIGVRVGDHGAVVEALEVGMAADRVLELLCEGDPHTSAEKHYQTTIALLLSEGSDPLAALSARCDNTTVQMLLLERLPPLRP